MAPKGQQLTVHAPVQWELLLLAAASASLTQSSVGERSHAST
jgi:hypothetical protein